MKNPYDILGIGAPILDRIIPVKDDFIRNLPGGKGGMILIDSATCADFLTNFEGIGSIAPGGSAANVIKTLAHFNQKCAFLGKIGHGTIGKDFWEPTLLEQNIVPLFSYSATPTGIAFCFVTPDGERTMRTYLGAGMEMSSKDIRPSIFDGIKLLHMEGYNLVKGDLVEKSFEHAKNAGALISFDLSGYEIVEQYREKVLFLLEKYVDIVIANTDEAKALTQLSGSDACSFLSNICLCAVVMAGKLGCYAGSKEQLIYQPVDSVEPIDSTGAGDLFTGGFLYAYLKGFPLEKCAKLGNILGKHAVQVLGADLPSETWITIKKSSIL